MANRFLNNIRINDEYTLPAADGSADQVITTDGSGNLSFTDIVAAEADKALSLTLRVKNTESVALTKGQVVCAAPTATPPSGNVIEVKLADNNGTDSMPAIGVLNEGLDAAGGANDEGEAIMFGRISGIDTSAFSVGDEVFVSDTPGALTTTKPTGVKYIQKVGVVMRDDASNGTIEVFGAGRTNDVPTPLYIDHTNQRVGIGEETPLADLHINKDSTPPELRLSFEPASGYGGGGDIKIVGGYNDYVYGGIGWYNGGLRDSRLIYAAASREMSFGVNERGVSANGYFRFYDGSTEIAEINSAGIYGNVFYDQGNTAYYVNPASTSTVNVVNFAGYSSANGGFQIKRDLGTTSPSWPTSDHTLSLENSDAGYLSINFHRAGHTSHNIWYTGTEFITDDTFRSTVDMRAPIFYDSDNTDYYLNPASTGNAFNALGYAHIRGGVTTDGSARSYTWRAVDNTSSSGIRYQKIARITSSQSSRFVIELAGRSTSYSDNSLPALGYIVGQLNNDNNYDLVFYNHSGEDTVVDEVGQVDVSTTATDIYIKVSDFSEVTAHAHISDGTIAVESTSAGGTEPTNYVAATNIGVWNSRNDGSGSGLDADLLDGQHASAFQPAGSYLTTTGKAADSNLLDGINSTSFLRSDANDTFTGTITGNILYLGGSQITSSSAKLQVNGFQRTGTIFLHEGTSAGANNYPLETVGSELRWNTNKVWTSANDGAGSGLDADLLDGQHASAFAASSHTHTWANISGETANSVNTWGGLRHETNDGYIDFGPANANHAHIYTDRPNFYLNKSLQVNGQSIINTVDIRAYRFYDLNNTSYYLDPASTSVLNELTVDANLKATGTTLSLWAGGNQIMNIDSAGRVYPNTDSAYDLGVSATIAWRNLYVDNIFTNNNIVSTNGYIWGGSDVRAPIFYDSNDTTYYIDPNSTSRSARLRGEILIGPNTSSKYLRLGGNGGNTDYSTISTSNGNLHIDSTAGFATYLNHYASGNVLVGNGGGYLHVYNSVRSPIFYDLNNTAYYVNPASTSVVNDLSGTRIWAGYDANVDNSISCSEWFRSSGNTGWYNASYSGGIYMVDSTWVRVYNNKKFYADNTIESNSGMYAPIFYDRNNTNYRFNGDASKDNVDLTSSGNYAVHVLGTISGGHRKHGNLETPEMQWSLGGGTDLNWKKLCDVVISDATYAGWGAEIEITNFSGNFGSATYSGGELFKGALSIYHWGGTGTTPEIAYANIPYEMRDHVRWYKINETGQNRYQLQVKSPGNFQQLYVKVKPGIGNQVADIITYGNDTNGATSGGTASASLQNANFNHEFAGGIWTNDTRSIGFKNAYGSPSLSSYYGTLTTSTSLYVGGPSSTTTSLYAGPIRGTVFYERSNSAYYMDGSNTGDSIRVAGDVVAYYSSDKRLKDNIKPIENALDKVNAINGVTFEWNEKSHKATGRKDVGVVAQEVEEVFPEIVQTRSNGYKAVDYQKLTAVLIESVKELTAKVEALEAKQCNCK